MNCSVLSPTACVRSPRDTRAGNIAVSAGFAIAQDV